MQNSTQQPPKTQTSNWLTQNCGRRMTFADVVAKAAEREALLPELALEYLARNAALAARLADVNRIGGEL